MIFFAIHVQKWQVCESCFVSTSRGHNTQSSYSNLSLFWPLHKMACQNLSALLTADGRTKVTSIFNRHSRSTPLGTWSTCVQIIMCAGTPKGERSTTQIQHTDRELHPNTPLPRKSTVQARECKTCVWKVPICNSVWILDSVSKYSN